MGAGEGRAHISVLTFQGPGPAPRAPKGRPSTLLPIRAPRAPRGSPNRPERPPNASREGVRITKKGNYHFFVVKLCLSLVRAGRTGKLRAGPGRTGPDKVCRQSFGNHGNYHFYHK